MIGFYGFTREEFFGPRATTVDRWLTAIIIPLVPLLGATLAGLIVWAMMTV